MNRRVVVTGMGVVAPNGSKLDDFRNNLIHGRSGIQYIDALRESGFNCTVGGIATRDESAMPNFFSENHLDKTSDYIQLACLAALEAWENAGLQIPPFDAKEVDWDTGVMIGSSVFGLDLVANQLIPLTNLKQIRRLGGYTSLNIMGSGATAYLSSILGCGNISMGISNACASGSNAIIEAYHRIKSGQARRMIAGGSEGFSIYHWASLDSMRVLNSSTNDRPTMASRPMSETANGFVPSSGAGMLILEDMHLALEREAEIFAEVKAGYTNGGGQCNGGSMTYPNQKGVVKCIKMALEMAQMDAVGVGLISGHLTSTKADVLEVESWVEIFSNRGQNFPVINSTKSIIGHSLGAAGAIESVASVLQIYHDTIHPSVNCEDVHPRIAKLIPSNSIPHDSIIDAGLDVVINGNFGFGDVNTALIFARWLGPAP